MQNTKDKRTLPGPVPHRPAVYRPNPPHSPAQPMFAKMPLTPAAPPHQQRSAPPAYRPQAQPVHPKTAGQTAPPKPGGPPPVYRPNRGVALRKPASPPSRRALQRAQEQIPKFPGFYFGALSPSQQEGTFNTTWSQTQTPSGHLTVAHASTKLTKFASSQLVGFAQIEHLEDEENTHAEDKLAAYIHQRVAESGKTGTVAITIPEFFVSASPCSSTYGTSAKSTGCTENLIAWHETGLSLAADVGCNVTAKLTITKLVVHHLYKGNTYEGANGSYAALQLMKKKGAIGSWHIQNMPGLKEFKGNADG